MAPLFNVVRPPAYVHDPSFPLRLSTNPLIGKNKLLHNLGEAPTTIQLLKLSFQELKLNPNFRIFSHTLWMII